MSMRSQLAALQSALANAAYGEYNFRYERLCVGVKAVIAAMEVEVKDGEHDNSGADVKEGS